MTITKKDAKIIRDHVIACGYDRPMIHADGRVTAYAQKMKNTDKPGRVFLGYAEDNLKLARIAP